jgi:hypothetical protein
MGKIARHKAAGFGRPSEERGIEKETAERVGASALTRGLKAGRYVRLTLTVRPEQWERIKEELPAALAAEIEETTGWPVQVSVLEVSRWLLDEGLKAYDAGERPEMRPLKVKLEE